MYEEKVNCQCRYNISVIIPTYNRRDTIERCISSVIKQSYPAYEIIVVDDGSKDGTIDIIELKYKNNVKLVKQKHKGAQAARNLGIKVALGEYVAFLDSDDEWINNKLELQVAELEKKPNAVICCNGYLQTDWNKKIPKIYANNYQKANTRKIMKLLGKNGYVFRYLLSYSFCLFPGLLTSKKNLVEIGLLDEKVPAYQEWDTAIQLAKKNEFVFINKPLFIYHLHDGKTISKSTKREIDGMEYNTRKFQYDILEQLGPQALTQRYYIILCKCLRYKDKRAIEYLFKLCFSKINVFLLK